MSVNRYTNVNWAPYQSVFTPRPFDEFYAVGQHMQKNYDEGKKLPGMLDDIASKIDNTPYHEGLKQSLLNDTNKKMSELVDKYNGNYADEGFKRDANRLITGFVNDPKYQTIKNEKKLYDNVVKDIAEHPEDINDFALPGQNDQLDTGYLIHKGKNTVKFANHLDDAKQYTDHIISDEDLHGAGISKDSSGNYFIINNRTKEHIDAPRIMQLAQQVVPSYADTKGGRYRIGQFVRDYVPQLGEHISKLDYNSIKSVLNNSSPELSKQLDTYLANDIAAPGLQKIHEKIKGTIGMHDEKLALERGKKDIWNPKPSASTSDTYISTSDNIPMFMKDIVSSDGTVDPKLVEKSLNDKSTTDYVNINGDKISIKNLPTGYKVVQHGSGETSITDVVTPDGKTLNIERGIAGDLVKENIDKIGKFTGEAIVRFGISTKNEDGSEKTPYQKMNDALAVVGANSVLANSGTNYTNYPNVEKGITEAGRGYSKNEAAMFTNMQASNLDGSDAVDAQTFFKNKEIDPKSVKFSEYDFSSPGSKKWVGLNKKGEQISFIMSSKDLNERAHFAGITSVNNDIKKYLEGKPVDYKLIKAKDTNNNETPAYKVGKVTYDSKGNKLQAIYEPKYKQFFITVNDQIPTKVENGKILPMDYNQYREQVTNDWVGGKYGIITNQGQPVKVEDTDNEDGQ